MPRDISIQFTQSPLRGIQLRHYGADESKDHGAPCMLILQKGDMPGEHFWECARVIQEALNATWDNVNIRYPEFDNAFSTALFPLWYHSGGRKGRHALAGGEDAYLDSIRREDLAIVATKALREMRAMGLIDESDYKGALDQLSEQGMRAEPYSGLRYKEGQERTPTQIGQLLAVSTARYLEAEFRRPSPRVSSAIAVYGR
ncbi:MAG: hypothetical protein SFW62_08520 [Alphaproteobacteria bacterium]|nr:hypothetical protein [Alphaproteobacteria bacterium]